MLTVLRVLIGLTVVGILIMGVSVVQALVQRGDKTPRSATERAIMSAEEAVKVNPNDAKARVRLGAAYLERGDTKKAIEQAEIALRLDPDAPAPHFVLGVAHRRDGDLDAAVKSLTTAGETQGEYAQFYQEVYIELARTLEDKDDIEAALASLEKAVRYGPENALVTLERAEMLERASRWEEAAYDFGYTLIFVPDLEEAQAGLARMQEQHPNEYAAAMKLLDAFKAQSKPAHSTTETTGASDAQ